MRVHNKFKKLILMIAILTLTIILSGCESSLKINRITINTTINKDGSVKMEESINFHYSEGKEPITKNIYFPDGSEVKNLVVSDSNGSEYKQVTNLNTSTETSKVYTKITGNKNLIILEIYSPDNVEDETYNVTYTLANIATKYSDSGHFVWTYVGKSTDVNIGKVAVNVKFESEFDKGKVQVDLNGPLEKNVQVDGSGISTYVNNFPTNTLYEISVLFPNDYIAKSTKTSSETIKDKVATTEAEWAAYDNARSTNIKIYKYSMIGIFILLILFSVYFYYKYCRKGFTLDGFKIYKELPIETSPVLIKRFLNAKIGAVDVVATALDLLRRGYIEYSPYSSVFAGRKHLDGKIKSHERVFMNLFLNTLGKNRKFVVKDIETKKIDSVEAKKIQVDYTTWKRYIDSDKEKEFAFKNNNLNGLAKGFVFSSIVTLAIIILSIALKKFTLLTGVNIIVIVFLLYLIIFKRKKSSEEDFFYNKFMGFKEFLRDRESLVEVMSRDISLAEKYLPYAIALGVHKEFLDILENNINSKNINGFEKLKYMNFNDQFYFQGISKIIDEIEAYLKKAIASA
ncbi:MAG: DUF2207 domain-containing protein [Clostridiaceae bacterium]